LVALGRSLIALMYQRGEKSRLSGCKAQSPFHGRKSPCMGEKQSEKEEVEEGEE